CDLRALNSFPTRRSSDLQACAWIMLFKLVNQPARIINADVKLLTGAPQKRARKFAEFPSRFAGQYGQLRAAGPINQTIFEIDSRSEEHTSELQSQSNLVC